MADNQIVQIRKKGGLHEIKTSKGFFSINEYSQDIKDREKDGTHMGEFRGTIPDTKHFLSPWWSDLKKQWSWGGTEEQLAVLIKKMKLRYLPGHPREGQIIEPGENVAERLTYIKDEVFTHPSLYGLHYMENGKGNVSLNDPVQQFLLLCYKGDQTVQDKSVDKPLSKYIAGNLKYEILSPKIENLKKKRTADKEVKAIMLLSALNGDEDKMRAVAEVMDLPHYDSNSDINGLFILLKDTAAQNTASSTKYNGKTYQERFIEVAEMKTDELDICRNVLKAKKNGIIRKRSGYFLLKDDKIDGEYNDLQLIEYFKDPKNQGRYLTLLDLIEFEKR